jgi:hypothetical protein
MFDLYHVTRSEPYNDFPKLKVGDFFSVGSVFNPFFSCFDKYPDYAESKDGSALLERELLLEDVRSNYYSHMPSRQTCLWVTRSLSEAIEWFQHFVNLGNLEISLVTLETSDEPFKVDSMLLPLEKDSPEEKLEKVHAYWSGRMSINPMPEYLFEGQAKVKAISPLHH